MDDAPVGPTDVIVTSEDGDRIISDQHSQVLQVKQGSVHNAGTGTQRHVHIELSGPHGVIKNCAATTIGPLQTIYCTWSPHATEPAGKYCATGWQYASGQYHNVGEPCVNVQK